VLFFPAGNRAPLGFTGNTSSSVDLRLFLEAETSFPAALPKLTLDEQYG
jgi:hypothetical protein